MTPRKPSDILEAYEQLAEITGRMRAAASLENWDSVVELETECSALYNRLASIESGVAGDSDYQRRKSELICRLLEDDADIRAKVSGQLNNIWRLIDGRANVDRLSSAYGVGGTESRC